MNICRFNKDRLGVVEGDKVYDVSAALRALPAASWPPVPGDPIMLHFDALKRAIAEARPSATAHALKDVKLYSLICAPSKIMAAPANYALHALEAKDPGISHGLHDKQLEGVARPVDKLQQLPPLAFFVQRISHAALPATAACTFPCAGGGRAEMNYSITSVFSAAAPTRALTPCALMYASKTTSSKTTSSAPSTKATAVNTMVYTVHYYYTCLQTQHQWSRPLSYLSSIIPFCTSRRATDCLNSCSSACRRALTDTAVSSMPCSLCTSSFRS